MYKLSDSLAQYAANPYSGEPLTIEKAIYVSCTQRPLADDSLDTDLNQILPVGAIRDKGGVVRFGDGRESRVIYTVNSLFSRGVFWANRENVPELYLKEPSDRLYLIFNVRAEKEEEVILTLPGRGVIKIWLENTLIAYDSYISRHEDMCICPLKKGDNFFTVQLEQNPLYPDSTYFSMEVYPSDYSFERHHCPEIADAYPRDFLRYNTRQQFRFCWNRYEEVNTRFFLLPRDFSFFSTDDIVSVKVIDSSGDEIYQRECRFGELLDLAELHLTAPVKIQAEARGIINEQVFLPAPLEDCLTAFRNEYIAFEQAISHADPEIKNNIDTIIRFLSAERWCEENDEGYSERNAILKFPGTGLSEEIGYELYNAWRLLHHARKGKTYTEFMNEAKMFTHAYLSPYGNTWQRVGLYLPNGYSPDKEYPLLVLNTTAPEVAILYERYKLLKNSFAGTDLIIAAVMGRGVTTGNILCEMSFLDNLRELRRLFSLDPDRIYLMGDCNGAYSTWAIAEAYPHLFAGICTITGKPVANTLVNLSNTAVLSISESQETGLGYYESFQQPKNILSRINPDYRGFTLQEDHVDIFKFLLSSFAIRHLLSYTRCQYPRKIQYASEKDRHHQAYYLDILSVDRTAHQAKIVSEINENSDSITIFTGGIRKLNIAIPPYLADVIMVKVNGQTTELNIANSTDIVVEVSSKCTVEAIVRHGKREIESAGWGEGLLGIFDRNITIFTPKDMGYAKAAKTFSSPSTNGIYPHTDIQFAINTDPGETDNLVFIGTGKNSDEIQIREDGFTYNGQDYTGPYSLMWIEYDAGYDRKVLYASGNASGLFRSNIFLRRLLIPSPANKRHPYLNMSVLLFDGKQYYGARNPGDELVPITGEEEKEKSNVWDFSEEETRNHFVASEHLINPSVNESGVMYEICGSDPNIVNNRTGCSISSAKTVKLQFLNDSPGCIAQLFYTSTRSPNFQVKFFTIQEHDTAMREYVLDMAEEPMWDGTLGILRLDPAHDDAMTGTVTIGRISVEEKGPQYDYARQFAFSQGVNHWYYQHSNGSAYADMRWNEQKRQWEGRSGCTIRGSEFTCGYPFTTVLKHICQREGTVRITGKYRVLTDHQNDSLRLRHNLGLVREINSIEEPAELDVLLNVKNGDSLYFELCNTDYKNTPLRAILMPIIEYLS